MERAAEFAEKTEEKVNRNERSRTKEKEEAQKETESGYSEAQQALDIEMRSGDLSALKKSSKFQHLSLRVKRLVAYRAVTVRLRDVLVLYVGLVGSNPHRAKKLLDEMLALRKVQTYLFDTILGKTADIIDVASLPEELREFVI